jgi:hypothetical protein
MKAHIKPVIRLQNAVVGHNALNLGHNVGDVGTGDLAQLVTPACGALD